MWPGMAGSDPAWMGLLWCGSVRQGLQTAVRRVLPPYCSLGNRYGEMSSGMAAWGTASWAMAGLLGLRLTPQALNFIH